MSKGMNPSPSDNRPVKQRKTEKVSSADDVLENQGNYPIGKCAVCRKEKVLPTILVRGEIIFTPKLFEICQKCYKDFFDSQGYRLQSCSICQDWAGKHGDYFIGELGNYYCLKCVRSVPHKNKKKEK